MYIEKYWDNYIGGSDDSMTLLDYLADKQKEEISFNEIFSDSGLDKLDSFRKTDVELSLSVEGFEAEIYYAIDLLMDIAALLLECKINGSVDLGELSDMYEPDSIIQIMATQEEHVMINNVLKDFVDEPFLYDLSEMMSEEEMQEMAEVCKELREELYG